MGRDGEMREKEGVKIQRERADRGTRKEVHVENNGYDRKKMCKGSYSTRKH